MESEIVRRLLVMRNGLGKQELPEAVSHEPTNEPPTHPYLCAPWNSFTYSPYPSAASWLTGMNRIDAEFMQ